MEDATNMLFLCMIFSCQVLQRVSVAFGIYLLSCSFIERITAAQIETVITVDFRVASIAIRRIVIVMKAEKSSLTIVTATARFAIIEIMVIVAASDQYCQYQQLQVR